ncbi:MAG: MarR family winged helix-turn-helix transcriptional regulator [Devosiaceae bacterium]|nr:MarR family winged helix-turn-helix transcriptional regulator [Devosiaceae bacterium]
MSIKNRTDFNSENELEYLRQTNLGRLIDDLHFFFESQALGYLREENYLMIKSADAHVMRTMRLEGSRVTDMARQAGISKQAMSKLVQGFVEHGFLAWSNDPKDKRNRIVNVTKEGRELLSCGLKALANAEKDVAEIIGETETEQFRELLLKIKQARNIRPVTQNTFDRRRRA